MDISARAELERTATRSFTFTECEFRDDGPNGWVTFEGVASVVDTPYSVRDQFGEFTETIQAGAFDKTLSELKQRASKAKNDSGQYPDMALFINHDYRNLPLATVASGNLEVWASPHLNMRAFLNPARPSVQETRHAVADGQARQMSIGFTVPDKAKDLWSEDYTQRTITEAKVTEGSIVWRGASPTTTGNMRSYDSFMRSMKDVDMTKDQARRMIKSLERRFANVWNEEVQSWLELALKARFGANVYYIDVEDFKDDAVVFCMYGDKVDGLFQLAYTLNSDNTVTLSDADPTPVNEVSQYVAVRSIGDFSDRDRADRERLERKIAARPAPLV
jgi:HK97 family phage prohead protease